MMNFNELPMDVQEKAKEVLKAYDRVYVVYEDGAYHASAGIAIKAVYAADHKFISEYKATEIFTEAEQILNYMESFHEYHPSYKGNRDYRWLNTLTYDDKFEFDEAGNIVKA